MAGVPFFLFDVVTAVDLPLCLLDQELSSFDSAGVRLRRLFFLRILIKQLLLLAIMIAFVSMFVCF